jgi:transposase
VKKLQSKYNEVIDQMIATPNKKSRLNRQVSSKRDARKCEKNVLAEIRVRSVMSIVEENRPISSTAATFGVSERVLYYWLNRYKTIGYDALNAKKVMKNKKFSLSFEQEKKLCVMIIEKIPTNFGLLGVLWTAKIIAELVLNQFHISISARTASRIMRRHGLSPQKPIRKAYQANKEEVRIWCEETFPKIKAHAMKTNTKVFFLDECTVKSQANYGTTWSIKGKTPLVPANGRESRTNVIAIVSEEGEMHSMEVNGTIDSDVFCCFIDHIHGFLKENIVIILDNAAFHKSKKVRALEKNMLVG